LKFGDDEALWVLLVTKKNIILIRFLVVFIFLAFVCITSSQNPYDSHNPPDYCKNQAELCKYQGLKHFACNKTNEFAPTCSAVRDVVPMTQARIDLILNLHNSFRSQVALGQLTGGLNGATFPQATRMATLKWNQELSDLALLNAKQCKMQHDACHNTADFEFSGQNLGISSTSINFKDPDVVINGLTNAWFNEYKNANASNIANCCFSYSKWEGIFKAKKKNFHGNFVYSADIGHFLTFVIDRSTHIGCAMTKFIKDGSWKTYLFACNYASASIAGYQIYRPGQAASACITGINPEHPGLCSNNESINANIFWSAWNVTRT
jgi:Cysteine-rich secretory protein family